VKTSRPRSKNSARTAGVGEIPSPLPFRRLPEIPAADPPRLLPQNQLRRRQPLRPVTEETAATRPAATPHEPRLKTRFLRQGNRERKRHLPLE
jgi:hypothetical protein